MSPQSISTNSRSSSSNCVMATPSVMPWVWSCHRCHTRYPLAATRRCLIDGHYFCGGTTIDKVTGKVRRHKACTSEFDYNGWESFGRWKRQQVRQHPSDKIFVRHCEEQCSFPSACHWKTKQNKKKNKGFDFVGPKDLAPEPQSTAAAAEAESPKQNGSYVNNLIQAAEKRSTQLTTLLSTIQEEDYFTSMPQFVPAITTNPPKLPELKGLGLTLPAVDFSGLKTMIEDHLRPSVDDNPTKTELESISSPSAPPSSTDTTENQITDDFETVTRPAEEDKEQPPNPALSLTSEEEDIPFNFDLDPELEAGQQQDPDSDPSPSTLKDPDSPILPTRKAWEWTANGVGIALSTPTSEPFGQDDWHEKGHDDDEVEDENEKWDADPLMWDRGSGTFVK